MSINVTNLLYLVTIVTFILALRYLSNPAHARRGNQIGAAGMLLAIVVTWIDIGTTSWWAIAIGMLIGGGFGAVAARKVKMTAMPQMVALFNGVGGGAAALIALAELHRILPEAGKPTEDISVAIAFSALIGAISFSGSTGRVREAAGADRRSSDHVGRAAVRERRAVHRRRRLRRRARAPACRTSGCSGC